MLMRRRTNPDMNGVKHRVVRRRRRPSSSSASVAAVVPVVHRQLRLIAGRGALPRCTPGPSNSDPGRGEEVAVGASTDALCGSKLSPSRLVRTTQALGLEGAPKYARLPCESQTPTEHLLGLSCDSCSNSKLVDIENAGGADGTMSVDVRRCATTLPDFAQRQRPVCYLLSDRSGTRAFAFD